MEGIFATMRRLHARGPTARGLVVDAEGVTLGPDCALVWRAARGYRRTSDEALRRIQELTFGTSAALPRLSVMLDRIAATLAAGDITKAQILGLELAFIELDDDRLRKLAHAAPLLKAYDPHEPRDENGRWTSEGAGTAEGRTPRPPRTMIASAELVAPGLASDLAPLWARIAAGADPAVVAFGLLLISSGSGNNLEGMLPGSANIGYHFDEGRLSLYYTDVDGIRVSLFSGRPDNEGLYRDAEGHAIARQLESGLGFVLDPDTLPGLAAKAKVRTSDVVDPAAITAAVEAYNAKVTAAAKSQPQLCPPATPDPGGNQSARSALYQWQVCGLPPGWGVEINGVRFDGCFDPRGPVVECKGLGIADMMKGEPTDEWPWPPWFTTQTDTGKPTGMTAIVNQMRRQNIVAGELGIQAYWLVADPRLEFWFRAYAASHGYTNIKVFYVPPPPVDLNMLRRSVEV